MLDWAQNQLGMSMPVHSSLQGLSSEEAARRLRQYGPNQVGANRHPAWLILLRKFWSPVPWMLEAAIVLQLVLGKPDEAIVMAVLLGFNAILGFSQEQRANRALELLRSKLEIRARVLRDGTWQSLPAPQLVPGDAIHLRMGDIVPADLQLADGEILLDQSVLTGESLPVTLHGTDKAFAGTTVRRGEASGTVSATGARTQFGKTAGLIDTARPVSHLEELIFSIVRYLIVLDAMLIAAMIVYGLSTGKPLTEIVPFSLILLIASIPIALPATYTLATALGALELAAHGVLVTRLSAIEDAAAMDVLASDKTGTITRNQLSVAATLPFAPADAVSLLRWAAIASDPATQDPLDLAILTADRAAQPDVPVPERLQFIPFAPDTKRSEARFMDGTRHMHVIKGAPHAVAALVPGAPDVQAMVDRLGEQGMRVLAVAIGEGDALQLAGLVGLSDPPREDSAALIARLDKLGVRVIMVSGDSAATARAIARQVGLGERVCPADTVQDGMNHPLDYDIFARVLPEDKFHLVHALQHDGHITGMSGDGVNDAPALKQAEVGIAVASATDVAKAAASLVLTSPGLSDVCNAVETSRRIYQRMLTYTLNKIIKTLEIALFLSVGLMLTGTFVITPMLIVLLLFTNDFATMSIASDRAQGSDRPERWNVPALMGIAGLLAGGMLVLSFSVFFFARNVLHLPLPQLQTLIFLMLVFSGQGTIYLVRVRGPFWQSRPGKWLLRTSLLDIALVSLLATHGILMTAIAPARVAELLATIIVWLLILDVVKTAIFRRLCFQNA